MIVSERRLGNKTTTEARFYLSSLSSNAEIIAGAIRSHWGIENSLHWTLDGNCSPQLRCGIANDGDRAGLCCICCKCSKGLSQSRRK